MSVREPKEKSKLMKYMSYGGFHLHSVAQYEDSIDSHTGKFFDWVDKCVLVLFLI